ncbi:4-coumarate--CoA ligase 1-like [Ipomoea triloba]|uniref:4-coumarate--CoA ligase 1-like n=1 Tax=Ipomoea triloba TaxID=35885 RepID=UPI00125E5D2E|nr:4-coumarate--CoA ligase 1-like [Ipomoea triloba]
MSGVDGWLFPIVDEPPVVGRRGGGGGFDSKTGIYHSLLQLDEHSKIPTSPDLDTATFVLSQFPNISMAESRVALVDSATKQSVTYAQIQRSIALLATGLHHGLGVRKGDVVFVLSPNSLLYPVICLAVLKVGAVLSTSNPLNTPAEIAKQVSISGAKLAIAAPEEVHKLVPTGVPTLYTTRPKDDNANALSIEELIENCEPQDLPECRPSQSDTAAILYSSGTTGVSKGVVLTHANLVAVMTLLKWYVVSTSSQDDVFLCFVPMFHIYGLAFFGLGLFCLGTTTVLMQKFDFQAMLEAIQTHKVNHIPAVPPVILGLVKYNRGGYDLSSLRRVGSGAAPLSKEVADGFRKKFPWVELRPGYGLTESSGAATFFSSSQEANARPASSGLLFPCMSAKVVDTETGEALAPLKQGELWLRGPNIMNEYIGNQEATANTLDSDGWLKTGDLGYFDEDGYLYIVDRIKELIKHNGYQVAPAELEAVLLTHANILDAAVVPLEDEEAGEIPVAYVVRASGSELTEEQVIQFVASQVAPYKKVRRVNFISQIPRSTAGKILRKELVSQSKQSVPSKL